MCQLGMGNKGMFMQHSRGRSYELQYTGDLVAQDPGSALSLGVDSS